MTKTVNFFAKRFILDVWQGSENGFFMLKPLVESTGKQSLQGLFLIKFAGGRP